MLGSRGAMSQYIDNKKRKREVVTVTLDELIEKLIEHGHSPKDAKFHAQTTEVLGSQINLGDLAYKIGK